ncbi:DUF6191 domain-containing protein [Streptomyces xantholiticus]|uniref:DUF6191 domain-containing protein n=1 Tax=Streptomyces xantholiticus TaxID=68285 RepID=UPI0016739C5F|nr:DUF6191 domain-containing protein [Streptomyces xantholiticus]GGW46430.1 hypothetical protein GCM10010381_34470 [Streptomyces xantholiticus]
MFNAFEEIFAPGRKHTDDERNRLALTRVDVGDGDPGRGPVDLASGKVTVRPPAAQSAVDADDAARDEAAGDRPLARGAGAPPHDVMDTSAPAETDGG